MKTVDPQELCMQLLHADSEAEVESILKRHNLLDNPRHWRALGDTASNSSIIGSQQGEADLALVEKVTNAIDAILLEEVRARGIDPEGREAPRTIQEASAQYIFKREPGSFSFGDIPEEDLDRIADRITLSLTGSKKTPSVTISDNGEGQTPDDMPTTLLSLPVRKSNKNRIPFVQGKFNMGSTGALRFAGQFSTQLILSKRHPALVAQDQPNLWGFTIVRRFYSEDRLSVYKYLAPLGSRKNPENGQVLRFEAETLPIFPDTGNPYVRRSPSGTLIKLYDYDAQGFRGPAIDRSNLLGRLNVLLVAPPMPFSIFEHRAYDEASRGASRIDGIKRDLEESPHLIEAGCPLNASIKINGETLYASIFVLKNKVTSPMKADEGVVFLVNGQLHGTLPRSFFASEGVGYSYLEKSLFVTVDCSQLSAQTVERLFFNSRDRMSLSSDIGIKVRGGLAEILRSSKLLEELNFQRREQAVGKLIEFDAAGRSLLHQLIKDSPWLTEVLREGNIIRHITEGVTAGTADPVPPEEVSRGNSRDNPQRFEGKLFPTFFKIRSRNGSDRIALRWVSPGDDMRIYFETDVVDDYFSRQVTPGSFRAFSERSGKRTELPSFTGPLLNGGLAYVGVKVPIDWESGDTTRGKQYDLYFETADETQKTPFTNMCRLYVCKPNPASTQNRGWSHNAAIPSTIGGPQITWITQDQWANFGMDQESAVRVLIGYDRQRQPTYDFFVNRDNIHLQTELAKGDTSTETLTSLFKISLITLALSAIRGARMRYQNTVAGDMQLEQTQSLARKIEIYVARQTDNAAPIVLPLLKTTSASVVEGILRQEGISDIARGNIKHRRRRLGSEPG